MASSTLLLLLLLLVLSCFTTMSDAKLDHGASLFNTNLAMSDASLEYWPTMSSTLYDGDSDSDDEENDVVGDRRSLYWRRFYISYGALSANRIPCPPRSGRSYYTPNCYRAGGPVHPYTRGCSAITRCRG